ncbi:MAG: hypothetical protein R3C52_15730 [Hyphomonadaceae bacterium]
MSAFSPSLDPTGAVLARARNDATGALRRRPHVAALAGVQGRGQLYARGQSAGAGFRSLAGRRRPADGRSGAGRRGGDLIRPNLPQHRNPGAGGAHRRSGEQRRGDPAFGDYRADEAGLELEQGAWTGGVRWLSSNSGWRAGPGDYEALEVGLVRQGERWRFGAEYATADDDLTQTEGTSWLVGVGRKLGDHVDLGVAYMRADMDFTVSPGGFRHIDARNGALMVELSVRK